MSRHSVLVYGLQDPRVKVFRYVGKTTMGCAARRQAHILDAKRGRPHVSAWVMSLLNDGVEPEIVLIEECELENLNSRERFHIARLRQEGFALLNRTKGGTGGPYWQGKAFSPEHRSRIAQSLMGHVVSEATRNASRRNIASVRSRGLAGDFKKGQPACGRPFLKGLTPHNKGKSPSQETRDKISEGMKGNRNRKKV